MSVTTTTDTNPLPPEELQARLEAALANKDRPNGMTDEQIRQVFALAGRFKGKDVFGQAWNDGIAEYRRQVQEELERDLAEEDAK